MLYVKVESRNTTIMDYMVKDSVAGSANAGIVYGIPAGTKPFAKKALTFVSQK